jgi:hypothetical protein
VKESFVQCEFNSNHFVKEQFFQEHLLVCPQKPQQQVSHQQRREIEELREQMVKVAQRQFRNVG